MRIFYPVVICLQFVGDFQYFFRKIAFFFLQKHFYDENKTLQCFHSVPLKTQNFTLYRTKTLLFTFTFSLKSFKLQIDLFNVTPLTLRYALHE